MPKTSPAFIRHLRSIIKKQRRRQIRWEPKSVIVKDHDIGHKEEGLCLPRWRPTKINRGNHGGRNASPCTKRRSDQRKPHKKEFSNSCFMRGWIVDPFEDTLAIAKTDED